MSEPDDRVVAAAEHLQRAALEMIAAMRNALDVAEDLIGDPRTLQTLFTGAVTAAKSATETVQRIRVDE